jgi:hypothetical protein
MNWCRATVKRCVAACSHVYRWEFGVKAKYDWCYQRTQVDWVIHRKKIFSLGPSKFLCPSWVNLYILIVDYILDFEPRSAWNLILYTLDIFILFEFNLNPLPPPPLLLVFLFLLIVWWLRKLRKQKLIMQLNLILLQFLELNWAYYLVISSVMCDMFWSVFVVFVLNLHTVGESTSAYYLLWSHHLCVI